MRYAFIAYGHPNILATHKTTLEITKDRELTRKGDCIVAVAADFSLLQIGKIIATAAARSGKIKVTIAEAGIKEEITAAVNKSFSSSHEIVIRKGDFASERTLGISADKAAADLSRKLVEKLKSSEASVSITVENC